MQEYGFKTTHNVKKMALSCEQMSNFVEDSNFHWSKHLNNLKVQIHYQAGGGGGGRSSVLDHKRSSRLTSTVTVGNVALVKDLLNNERRFVV